LSSSLDRFIRRKSTQPTFNSSRTTAAGQRGLSTPLVIALSLPAYLGWPSIVAAGLAAKLLSQPPTGIAGTTLGFVGFVSLFIAPWSTGVLVLLMAWRRPTSRREWLLAIGAVLFVLLPLAAAGR
jgi:hypothetical protein